MSILSKVVTILRCNKNYGLRSSVIGTATKINRITLIRFYSPKESGLAKSDIRERGDVSRDVKPIGEKIKETTKTVSYTGIILVGVGVTGVIFYYVFRELFSSNSPNSIYSAALEKCKNDVRIEDALGAPIKGYGEETTRRRRTHVSHAVYEKNGVKHMRMRFYIKGVRNKGVVEVDMKQNEYGNYLFRYLLVQLDDFSGRSFIVEDNRAELDTIPEIDKQLPTLTLTQ